MPIYEFRCRKCKAVNEFLVRGAGLEALAEGLTEEIVTGLHVEATFTVEQPGSAGPSTP